MYRGREDNIFYRRDGRRITESGRYGLIAPGVLVLERDVIHAISNPLAQQSCGLHVYGGTLDNPARSLWKPFTFEEEPFRLPKFLGYEREMMNRVRQDPA